MGNMFYVYSGIRWRLPDDPQRRAASVLPRGDATPHLRGDQSAAQGETLLSTIQKTGLSIGGVIEHFENVLPKSQAEVSIVLQRLHTLGFATSRQKGLLRRKGLGSHRDLHPDMGIGTCESREALFALFIGAPLGFLGPDFWLATGSRNARAGFGAACLMSSICW